MRAGTKGTPLTILQAVQFLCDLFKFGFFKRMYGDIQSIFQLVLKGFEKKLLTLCVLRQLLLFSSDVREVGDENPYIP